jgi:HD domain-containing protein
VGEHVAELLQTIERWGEAGKRREDLRFLALLHDSLKNQVQNWRPHTGANHHATRARRFAERYTDDERLLATIEQHDRPYNIWRRSRRRGRVDEHAVDEMLDRIPDLDLFVRFVELDGSTEGKNKEPLRWFKAELAQRGLFEVPDAGAPSDTGERQH